MERIRKATSADAEFIAKMVIMALHMEKEGDEGERLLRHITELVMDEGSLYHWSRAVVIDGIGERDSIVTVVSTWFFSSRTNLP